MVFLVAELIERKPRPSHRSTITNIDSGKGRIVEFGRQEEDISVSGRSQITCGTPRRVALRALAAPCLACAAGLAFAGPPFQTDDPEPVELHHYEFYVATQQTLTSDGRSGTAPHLEFNYGAAYAFREPILRKELRRDRGRGYETTLADATGFDAGRQL